MSYGQEITNTSTVQNALQVWVMDRKHGDLKGEKLGGGGMMYREHVGARGGNCVYGRVRG